MAESNNKRIAKNTVLLYFRMLFTMAVSLYTSRIVLNTLGVSDFGIYNIVGGVVVLFSFFNNAMSNATQRFFNFELGKKDFEQLRKVFSASLNVHISIAVIVLLLSETLGLWFVNTQLNLPTNRMVAANWVYQLSILTFIVGIIQVPYNATIIAHEQMGFFAFISIIEVSLKLAVVFLLQYISFDKLNLYSMLIFVVSIVIISIYKLYCKRKYLSTHYSFIWAPSLYKELLSFSGWSLFGSVANVGKTQIINILLNVFHGVTVNAAMGITNQVSNALNGFVSNFQLAFNPQIVKSFAADERDYLMKLIFQTSKYSYFLLLFLSLPILLNMEYVLTLWLKSFPKYTVEFCQLTIIYLLIESISGPLWMSIHATGKIKNYNIIISSVVLLNVPLSYILLKHEIVPYSVFWVNIGISILSLLTKLYFLKKLIDFPVMEFINKVLVKVLLVTILSFPVPFLILKFINSGLVEFISISIVSWFFVGLSIFVIGIDKTDRKMFTKRVSMILRRSKI